MSLKDICIVSPNRDAYSETFIRAHLERLPARVHLLYGGYLPRYREDGSLLAPPPSLPLRAIRRAARHVLPISPESDRRRALTRYLRENRIAAVLAEYGPTGVTVMEACAAANVPLIVHFHGFDAYHTETLNGPGRRYPELFANAAAIIAVSQHMKNRLLHLGAPREKLYLNSYGVDTAVFQPGNPAIAQPIFVAVGRFVEKKAPHLTLLAFQRVNERVPEARLIMIGDGPLLSACKQLAASLQIAHAVEFRGARPHTEVAATMRQARAFVQHSMVAPDGDSEGTPVAVLEAGAAGLPVVATRHAGIPDVVLDGETGLLVEEGDITGMATAMHRLAVDPQLAHRLGRAGRERICAEFAIERSIENLSRIIQSIIRE